MRSIKNRLLLKGRKKKKNIITILSRRIASRKELDRKLEEIFNIKTAIRLLEANGKLPEVYRPHKLSGQYVGCWECHLKTDWLLIWEQNDTELILLFTGTGTHSDLF